MTARAERIASVTYQRLLGQLDELMRAEAVALRQGDTSMVLFYADLADDVKQQMATIRDGSR